MNNKKLIVSLLFSISICLTGCAALNDGLAQINSTLGEINGGLSGSSSKPISDKQTAVYALKNMQISETSAFNGTGYGKGLRLTGEAYNKTSKLVRLNLSIPIYDKGGFREGSLGGEITLSPKEKQRFEFDTPSAIPEGGKLDLNKFKVSQEKF
ncbi:DUF3568 family protein [Neisseria zalophi]|uniref:DUF3568 family protein n=1 Tax=Neisseria zalophi TaxID=640030 RepID=A0A5J6PSS0_9NEIS|nr:DUF3568 family protein [Neisseria zalophi]QEY25781.1 DUF3568 family protein [Neisseria zalophi]